VKVDFHKRFFFLLSVDILALYKMSFIDGRESINKTSWALGLLAKLVILTGSAGSLVQVYGDCSSTASVDSPRSLSQKLSRWQIPYM